MLGAMARIALRDPSQCRTVNDNTFFVRVEDSFSKKNMLEKARRSHHQIAEISYWPGHEFC